MERTAYEMRISDWSSDVCSSDLRGGWFDVGLQISIDGHGMPLLPLLVSLLRQSGERLTPARLRALPDDAPLIVRDDGGRLIRLPAARVKPILATLIELYDEQPLQKDGSLRRSEERRVGKEWVRKCSSRWSPDH